MSKRSIRKVRHHTPLREAARYLLEPHLDAKMLIDGVEYPIEVTSMTVESRAKKMVPLACGKTIKGQFEFRTSGGERFSVRYDGDEPAAIEVHLDGLLLCSLAKDGTLTIAPGESIDDDTANELRRLYRATFGRNVTV